MKTLITASILMLASSTVWAESWEDAWQSPDLGTGVYDKPLTLQDPTPSSRETMVSLDVFNEGNPDHASHAPSEGITSGTDEGFASSLDKFNEGNPDHV